MVWVTTEGGDYDNTVLKPYEEALQSAKVLDNCVQLCCSVLYCAVLCCAVLPCNATQNVAVLDMSVLILHIRAMMGYPDVHSHNSSLGACLLRSTRSGVALTTGTIP